jgi:hypothetical protein
MTPLFDIVHTGTWFSINKLPRSPKKKTDVFEVLTQECDVIGHIKWYSPWRCYGLFPKPEIVLEYRCMHELASFLAGLTLPMDKSRGFQTVHHCTSRGPVQARQDCALLPRSEPTFLPYRQS